MYCHSDNKTLSVTIEELLYVRNRRQLNAENCTLFQTWIDSQNREPADFARDNTPRREMPLVFGQLVMLSSKAPKETKKVFSEAVETEKTCKSQRRFINIHFYSNAADSIYKFPRNKVKWEKMYGIEFTEVRKQARTTVDVEQKVQTASFERTSNCIVENVNVRFK